MSNPYLAIVAAIVSAGILFSGAAASARAGRPVPVQQAGSPLAPVPEEIVAHWQRLIGTWITDNSEYRTDAEPFDAFGLDWSWGLGRQSLVGRLYGLRDGAEAGTFWEFREFWHPLDRQLVTMQFGAGGAYGVGPHEIRPDGTSEMVQTFFNPGMGTTERIGHRAELHGNEHVTASFAVAEDGTWAPRRTYTWIKQPAGSSR